MTKQTGALARGMDSNGDLYQRRAVRAFPLLVRQALAGQPVFYSQLASEMEIPNPRTLNFVLGAVGTSIIRLGKTWGEKIPPIQALVISKKDEMPGAGFIHSVVDPSVFLNAPKHVRRQIVAGMLADVFAYRKWPEVLTEFGLAKLKPHDVEDLSRTAPKLEGSGGGESDAHKALKEYIANHPQLVGVVSKLPEVFTEFRLPTGDAIDVLFKTKRKWVAVEVKSYISIEDDLLRGVFQCVKYLALLEASHKAEGLSLDVDVLLVLGGALPDTVKELGNVLGVEVLSEIGQTN